MHPALAEADLFTEDRETINTLLRTMPECYEALEYFYPKYERQKHKGLASSKTMIIDMTWPINTVKAIIVHECGHIVDLGYFKGSADAGISSFYDADIPMYNNDVSVSFYKFSWTEAFTKRANATIDDFCSRYGFTSDVFEDFATCYLLYNMHRNAFYERALTSEILMQKYLWFAVHAHHPTVANGTWQYNGIVPWDETALSVEWEF
jgi:hypothetical protein